MNTSNQIPLAVAVFAFLVLLGCGCGESQAGRDVVEGLPIVDPADLADVPKPEPPLDYAALVGVDDDDAPNDRLLGWVGHLDPEMEDQEYVRVTEAALESLRNGAEVFDCGPYLLDETLRNALKEAPDLKWLRTGRKTTASDLEWIAELDGLHGLSLRGADLTDGDLDELKTLTELRWLVVREAKLPDGWKLPSLPNLESLSMRYCNAGDSQMPVEGQFPKLRVLSAGNSDVTDQGVTQLVAANPGLEYLHLFGCVHVSAKSAKEIGKLKRLRYIHLGQTKLQAELYQHWHGRDGLPRLQVLIPKCYIGIGT